MKKTYIKPQLWVVATVPSELCYTSWRSQDEDGNVTGKDDYGKIIDDKGEGNYGKDEYDPWNSSNW